MVKRTMVAAMVIAMLGALGLSSARAEQKKAPKDKVQEEVKEAPNTAILDAEAPDFTLVDATGQKHSLSDYRGRYVVLEWVNFQCPFVRAQYGSGNMPALQKKYTAAGVVWLSICSSAPGKQGHFTGEELTKKIASMQSHATAYLIDENGKVGQMYRAKTTPHMFVINPKGVLIYDGAIDSQPTTDPDKVKESTNYVSAALTESMSGKPVEVKTSQPYGCSVKY